MSKPVRNARDVLHMTHHHFLVLDRGVLGASPRAHTAARGNGLVATEPGVAVILTGIHTGYVDVEVDLHDDTPTLDTADWDDVVEVPLESTHGGLAAGGSMSNAPIGLPLLSPNGPGHYRLRVHARGRDNAVDLVAEDPVEFYRLSVWPAPPAPEEIHKLTDHYGATLRAGYRASDPAPEPQYSPLTEDPATRALAEYLERERNQD